MLSSKDVVIAEIDENLAEAALGLLLTDGQVDGADTQQDGQEERLLVLADKVALGVLQLAFDVDAESLGPLR